MPISHILVPVDFSEKSHGAARYAESMHRRFGSRITLLHVLTPPYLEFGAMEAGGTVIEDLYRNRADMAKADLDHFLAAELPAGDTERLLVEGDPAATIVEQAHNLGSGLIVMPTHGYGTFRRFILGSVTGKVLHDADCPVWTGVHMETDTVEAVRFARVAVAIDLGPESERALMWASRFAASVDAELVVLYAGVNLEGRAGEYFDPKWKAHVEAEAREQVGALLARLQLTAPLLVDNGDTADTVCKMAKGWKADVLVIGRGSASGVFGHLLAHAYSIIRQAHCPVVSV